MSAAINKRIDIQLVRALAIASVCLYHAFPTLLPGGFTGVDVFFVLSGFLITRLLVAEEQRHGSINLRNFYARRFLRLAPALFLMIVVTAPLAQVLIAPPHESHFVAAATATLWLSNLHFAHESLDYFSEEGESNLFLHTWSLGVEEQFYLLWPVVCLLTIGALRSAAARHGQAAVSVVLVLAATVVCAVAFGLSAGTPQGFFLPTARLWEFFLGAGAYLVAGQRCIALPGGAVLTGGRAWLRILSAALMVLGLSGLTLGPGGKWSVILASALGSCLLLASLDLTQAERRRGSGWLKPFVLLGDLSYSLYLWHWPILTLGAVVAPGMSVGSRVLCLLLALAVSFLSYHGIENPVRRHGFLLARPRLAIGGALVLSLTLTATLVNLADRSSDLDFMMEALDPVYAQRFDAPRIYADGCDDWYRSSQPKECRYGVDRASGRVYMVGDSTLGQWFSPVLAAADSLQLGLSVYTKSNCPMVARDFYYWRIGREYTACTQWREAVIGAIIAAEPSVLILGSSFGYPFALEQWSRGTVDVLDAVAEYVGRIIVVASTPMLPFDPLDCAKNRYWQRHALGRAVTHGCVPREGGRSLRAEVNAVLQSVSARYPNVAFVDLYQRLCASADCLGAEASALVFRDRHHVADGFAAQADAVLRPLMGADRR